MMKYLWLGSLVLLPATGATQATSELRWFAPDSTYATWWSEVVQDCDCKSDVAYSSIAWFTMPGSMFACGADSCFGAFYDDPPTIVLAAPDQYRKKLVQHEMLHAILGTGEHRGTIWQHYHS